MSNPSSWHRIVINTHNRETEIKFRNSKDWCEQELGKRWSVHYRSGRWCCFWCGPGSHADYRFHFRESTDAALFALRWS